MKGHPSPSRPLDPIKPNNLETSPPEAQIGRSDRFGAQEKGNRGAADRRKEKESMHEMELDRRDAGVAGIQTQS